MKLRIPAVKIAMFAFVGLSIMSCEKDDKPNTPTATLYEVAQQNDNLSTFVQAIDLAGVKQSFESTSKFTVLAPTNAAFNDFLMENNYNGVDAIPVDVLKQLLFNHLLNANFKTENFNAGFITTFAYVPAANNRKISLLVDNSDGVKFNASSKIITSNLAAKNGYLHIVDKVISVPTMYDHIKNNPDLTILKSALDRNTASPVRNILSAGVQAPYTFFAPSNAAFTAYFDAINIETIAEIDDVQLQKILEYHIVPSSNISQSSFQNNEVLNTFQGQTLTVTLTGGGRKLTDVNGRVSTIIYGDMQGSNGIIHSIDVVLKP